MCVITQENCFSLCTRKYVFTDLFLLTGHLLNRQGSYIHELYRSEYCTDVQHLAYCTCCNLDMYYSYEVMWHDTHKLSYLTRVKINWIVINTKIKLSIPNIWVSAKRKTVFKKWRQCHFKVQHYDHIHTSFDMYHVWRMFLCTFIHPNNQCNSVIVSFSSQCIVSDIKMLTHWKSRGDNLGTVTMLG